MWNWAPSAGPFCCRAVSSVFGPQHSSDISLTLFSAADARCIEQWEMWGAECGLDSGYLWGHGIGVIACRLVASNRPKLTFFEGENIVPHLQNRHLCDGLVAPPMQDRGFAATRSTAANSGWRLIGDRDLSRTGCWAF
jgi:hypothetical protein